MTDMRIISYIKTTSRKSLIHFMAWTCLCATITSCTPRITTSIIQTYPALPIDSVEVFEENVPLPPHEILGNIEIKDRGTTTKCNYDYVLYLAKKETAAIGGNGLQITNHQKPSWASTCHQIVGNMLNITNHEIDSTSLFLHEETFGTQIYYNQQKRKAFNVIKASIGISRITSKVLSNYGEVHSKGGMDLFLEYEHIGTSGLGLGINAKYNRTSFGDGIDANLIYVGPSLVYSYITTAKFRWNLAIGLGYAHYNESDIAGSNQSGFGFLSKVGIDYLFSERWGIGIEANLISHRFSKPKGFQLKKNEYYGYNTIGLSLGFRHYF